MAEVHEVPEVREVPATVRRTSSGVMLLMFLLGVVSAVLLGVAALSIFGIHGTISWPAGRVELGQWQAGRIELGPKSVVATSHDGR